MVGLARPARQFGPNLFIDDGGGAAACSAGVIRGQVGFGASVRAARKT